MTDVMSPFASFRLNSSCPEWLSRALAAQLLSRAELCYDSALLFRHVGLCEPNPSSCLTNKQQIMLMAFTVMPSGAGGHMLKPGFLWVPAKSSTGQQCPYRASSLGDDFCRVLLPAGHASNCHIAIVVELP